MREPCDHRPERMSWRSWLCTCRCSDTMLLCEMTTSTTLFIMSRSVEDILCCMYLYVHLRYHSFQVFVKNLTGSLDLPSRDSSLTQGVCDGVHKTRTFQSDR